MKSVLTAAAAAALALGVVSSADAQTPKRGGVFTYAIEGEIPTLDCHQEVSIYLGALVRSMYSNLVRFDQNNYPNVVPDLAESWTVSPDGLTYTFKIRSGAKFHDGSTVSSADVKASFDRIRNPPTGIVSRRQPDFEDVASIDAPDASTVVFRLSQPNAVMLELIAGPFNCIYSARKLQENQKYPETAPMGSGPFVFEEYRVGAFRTAKRFDSYYRQGFPYLDGTRVVVMAANTPAQALEAGQIDALFRALTPAEEATLRRTLGDRISVPEIVLSQATLVTINNQRKPFDDARVRRALSLAFDRWGGLPGIQRIVNQKEVGGLLRPGFDLALTTPELEKMPGYGRDIEASRTEARRLLAEAGVPNLKMTLLNRNTGVFLPVGTYAVDQWRRVGIDATQEALGATPIVISRQTSGDYDATIEGYGAIDDPIGMFAKYLPDSPSNLGKFKDPLLGDLFKKLKVSSDRNERRQLANTFERRVLEQAYIMPVFWAGNSPGLRSYVKGWTLTPNFQFGYEMTEVWLDK